MTSNEIFLDGACRARCSSSAAATSPANSPASCTGWASRSRSSTAARRSCAASTTTCAPMSPPRWRRRGSPCRSIPTSSTSNAARRPLRRHRHPRRAARVRPGPLRHRPRPNTDGLGLAEAGVRLADSGAVIVDDYSQTNIPSVFAVGDVTDRVNLTPVAIREGHAFADTRVRRPPAQGRPQPDRQRRLHPPRGRHRRPDRGGGARPRPGRRLHDRLPPHAVGLCRQLSRGR
jgi:hypothetical protein